MRSADEAQPMSPATWAFQTDPIRGERRAVYAAGVRALLASLTLWALAAVVRLREIDQVIVSSDSLGPYLRAFSLSWSWIPRPPNPESGDGLWLLAWPLVQSAGSLVALMELRLVLGGLVAPAAFLAAWALVPDTAPRLQRWTAALTAGLLVAVDTGLVDTLISGARSYGAPELVGLATAALAWALRGHRWAAVLGAILLVLAVDHHPLAAGMGLALLAWHRPLRASLDRRSLVMAGILGGAFALPRVVRTGAQALCGEGPIQCLAGIAQSNVPEDVDRMAVIGTALHDRFAVDLGWIWPALLLGLILTLRRPATRAAGTWALGGLAGLLLLGMVVGYVRPYHLRIVAVPLAVAAALGLSRWWPACLALCIGAGVWGWTERPVGPDPGALARADAIAAEVVEVEGTLWVDQVWWDGPPRVDAPAVVLSAVLSGTDPSRFQLDPDATMILLTSAGPPAPWPPLMEGPGWRVHPVPGSAAAKAWVEERTHGPHSKGGALDWAAALHPRSADASHARW